MQSARQVINEIERIYLKYIVQTRGLVSRTLIAGEN